MSWSFSELSTLRENVYVYANMMPVSRNPFFFCFPQRSTLSISVAFLWNHLTVLCCDIFFPQSKLVSRKKLCFSLSQYELKSVWFLSPIKLTSFINRQKIGRDHVLHEKRDHFQDPKNHSTRSTSSSYG